MNAEYLRGKIERAIAVKQRYYHDRSAAESQRIWGHTGAFIAEWHFGTTQVVDAVMEQLEKEPVASRAVDTPSTPADEFKGDGTWDGVPEGSRSDNTATAVHKAWAADGTVSDFATYAKGWFASLNALVAELERFNRIGENPTSKNSAEDTAWYEGHPLPAVSDHLIKAISKWIQVRAQG